jgi:uncharacterized membrane protein YsdA (DUF1294 family)
MLDQLLDATFLYPLIIISLLGSTVLGDWIGRRFHRNKIKSEDLETLTVSILGLLALVLAFTLSHALSRYEDRRSVIVEEANAIDSTAHLASMLPAPAQAPILSLLRDYITVRINLGVPYDPEKLERDVAKSKDLLTRLWQQAVAVSEPQSLPANRFINSLDEMTKIQERRLSALRYHVPNVVVLMLLGVAMVAVGFTGYHAGLMETRPRLGTLIMAVMVAVVIMGVIDLDQPARGLIRVPNQSLLDVAKDLQP